MKFALVQTDPLDVVREFHDGNAPSDVFWPDGAASHGVEPGFQHGKWRLVRVRYDEAPHPEFYAPAGSTYRLADDALLVERTWAPIDIEIVRAVLIPRINEGAELARAKCLTPGVAQALVYQIKTSEALACLADPNPAPEKYPLLNATVGIDGETISDVAHSVLAASARFTAAAAAIEAKRFAACQAIASAENADEAVRSFAAIVW